MQLFHMIREECPHCRIENLIVVDGAVWGYQHIRFSKVPPRQKTKPEARLLDLNGEWEWFIRECQELGNAIIPEVHFRDGSPIVLYGDKPEGIAISPLGGDRAEPRRALAMV